MFEMFVNDLNGDNGDIQEVIIKIKEKRKMFFIIVFFRI